MKVAILSHLGFKQLHGGNLRAYFLIQELIKRGHRVKVILSSEKDVSDPIEEFDCEVVKIGSSISRWHSIKSKWFSFVDFIIRSSLYLGSSDVDVVYGICLVQALPAVIHKKIKSALLYVDIWADFYAYDQESEFLSGLIANTMRILERWTVRRADTVAVITETMKKMFHVNLNNKITVIPDGVDTQRFRPDIAASSVIKEYNLGNGPVIGYQGGVKRHEGLQFLAHAAPFILKKIPDACFLIVGKGDYLKTVKEIVKKNKTENRFIFTGWVDYYKIPEFLSVTTVSVVSMPDVDAGRPIISFKLLENLASGVPLVVNDLPGVREIVDEETVKFTKVEDPERLANDIVDVLINKDKMVSMLKRGRKKVEILDWRKIAELDADFVEGKDVKSKVEGIFSKLRETGA